MNIIEVVKSIISEAPGIEDFSGGEHIDYTDATTDGNYGVYPLGDSKYKEDILGNQTRIANFQLLAVNQSINDLDRLANSSFLLDLSSYLESIEEDKIDVEYGKDSTLMQGKLQKLNCSNQMLYTVGATENDPITYYLQIQATYKLYV